MKYFALILAVAAVGCQADPLILRTANAVLTELGNVLSSFTSSTPEKSSTTCECGATRTLNSRVINGMRTPFEGPVTVLAQVVNKTSGQIHATATIISANHVLSVAHAFVNYSASEFYVNVGNPFNEYRTGKVGNYSQKVEIEQILTHDYSGPPGRYNDISILVLKTPIELNSHVRAACLPKDDSDDFSGQTALIGGWGKLFNASQYLANEVRVGFVKVLDERSCNKAWSMVPLENPTQFCVDSPLQRASQGDSGGAVQVYDETIGRYLDIGIISYGTVNRDVHYPRVNTKISKFIPWIKSTVEGTGSQICTKV